MRKRKRNRVGVESEKRTPGQMTQGRKDVIGDLLAMPIGHFDSTAAFTLENDRNTPPIMMRDISWEGFSRIRASSGVDVFVVNQPDDRIGNVIAQELSPLFRFFVTRNMPYTAIPNMRYFAQTFQEVESLWQIACHVVAKYKLYNEFDWSVVPPGLSNAPYALLLDAQLWGVDSPSRFDVTWGPILQRISRLPIFPRVRDIIELHHSPFVDGDLDDTIKVFTTGQASVLEPGDLTTLINAMLTSLSGLESTAAETAAVQWLLQVWPHRCEYPSCDFIGPSPYHHQLWWNGSMNMFQVPSTTWETNMFLPLDTFQSQMGVQFSDTLLPVVNYANTRWWNPYNTFMVDTWGGRTSAFELATMPLVFVQYWDPVTEKFRVLLRSFVRMGPPLVPDDNGDLLEFKEMPLGFVDATWDDEATQYAQAIESRYLGVVAADADIDAYYRGWRHRDLIPCFMTGEGVDQLLSPATLHFYGFDELTELDAASAAARPGVMRAELANIYSRHHGKSRG